MTLIVNDEALLTRKGVNMIEVDGKIIETLGNISEDLDMLSINDPEGWNNLHKELENIIPGMPDEAAECVDLAGRCLDGFKAMAEKSVSDTFTLMESLYDALSAMERRLQDDPEGASLVENARRTIDKILPGAPEEAARVAGPEADAVQPDDNETPGVSLDDAAALLIQIEPEDADELNQLQDMLELLVEDESIPNQARELIADAAEMVDQIGGGGMDDPESALEEVGKLIETAMASAEHPLEPAEPPAREIESTLDVAEEEEEEAPDVVGEDEPTLVEAPPAAFEEAPEPPREEDDANYLPEDPDFEMLGEFVAEGSDLIASAEEALLTLETDPGDTEAVGTVFRAFHTVKGTAAFLDLLLVSELGHHAETLLSRVRDNEIQYRGGYADLSLRALDMIKELINRVQDALDGSPIYKPGGYDELMKLLADPEAAGISEEIDESPELRVGDILVAQGKVTREEVEEVAAAHKNEPIGLSMVKNKKTTATEVGQALRTQSKMSGPKRVETTVRVSTGRLDRLIDMVGELVIAHSMVAQDEIVMDGSNHDLAKRVSLTSKIVRELQDMSMSLRMVPLKATFNKMTRLVRDLGRKIGKTVNLVTEGEDTEIDRNLVDIINDPLVHMVRNAVDHGIEPPEVREKNGKGKQGVVSLSAYHSAGSVVVEIRDDGKGLDREVILAKGRERGLVTDGSSMTDSEVFQLLFEPGFSTAETVTDVSGRGVGMDVVKKNIESLRGEIEIQSELGRGSVFKMSLPLTLAIIDGMVVRVVGETFVIPTLSIVRSVKLKAEELSTVLKQGELIHLQGELIPLVRIAGLYDIDGASEGLEQALVVVVEDKGAQAGLLIDELVGRQQVVIKTLGEAMRDIPGIAGGAIMPNGRVGLILDVGGLLKLSNSERGAGLPKRAIN